MPRARNWVELVAAEATTADLHAHGERLREAGEPTGRVAREERAAATASALLQQRRRRIVELSALNDIAQQLATVHEPTDLLQGVVHEARRLLGVDLTYLALLEGEALRIVVASGQRTPQLVGVRLPADAGLIGRVASSAAPMWTPDYVSEKRIVHQADADDAASAEGLRGLLGVPLAVRGRVIGALLAAKRTERHFTDDEVQLLQALAGQASVAIDNARSREELAQSNAALQQALRLDEQLTAVVLEGGDLDAILARVGLLVPGDLTWAPSGEPVASPVIADVVAEVGDGADGLSVERDGVVAQPVLAAKRLLGVLVAATTDADRGTTHLVLERAAPILALTIAEARQAARASQLGRDIATIDLVSRRESDPRVDRERMRGAGLDPRRTFDVIVVDDPAAVPALRQRLPHVREATAVAYRDQAVLLVRHRTDWATAWPVDGPTAGLAGPVSGRLTFRDAYLDAARTARALAALGRTTGIARSDDLGVFG
ncbi:MAG TPA: GAF domain-containing protein, partial [Actinomycetes bacterium]|nr:GAF domain-containing protein [Actinomycetes bacterium]